MRMLASFSKAEDAHLVRSRLEGSGIAAYVRDENMVSVDWFYSNAIGGVKVDVADEDFAAASELLRAEQDLPSPIVTKAPRRRNLVALFLLASLGTFVVVAVRNDVLAEPREYAAPAVIGVIVGLGVVGITLLRRNAAK